MNIFVDNYLQINGTFKWNTVEHIIQELNDTNVSLHQTIDDDDERQQKKQQLHNRNQLKIQNIIINIASKWSYCKNSEVFVDEFDSKHISNGNKTMVNYKAKSNKNVFLILNMIVNFRRSIGEKRNQKLYCYIILWKEQQIGMIIFSQIVI